MAVESRDMLKSLHRVTGDVLTLCNRLMACAVVLGAVFFLMTLAAIHLSRQPEKMMNMQAFLFNYTEFAHAQAAPAQVATVPTARAPGKQDPNWDGTLAGSGIGFTLGRNIPLIGIIAGPITGAMLGFQMDSKI